MGDRTLDEYFTVEVSLSLSLRLASVIKSEWEKANLNCYLKNLSMLACSDINRNEIKRSFKKNKHFPDWYYWSVL